MRFRSIALGGLLAWSLPLVALAADLIPMGQFHWQSNRVEFGGFSGISLQNNGQTVFALSDRGRLFEAALTRENGRIMRMEVTAVHRVLERDGTAMRRFLSDAEGLEMAADGAHVIAFESYPRIWAYETPGGPARKLHVWDLFWALLGNQGLEALARDEAGTLWAISEEDGQVWTSQSQGGFAKGPKIPTADKFRITGADFGPDGLLYVVERRVKWMRSFATRIRRIDPDILDFGEVLLTDDTGLLDNSEGIDLWEDADGRTRLTLIADDNFSPFQKTVVTEFELVE